MLPKTHHPPQSKRIEIPKWNPPMINSTPVCWQYWEQGLYHPVLPADGVFYIWRNRGQLEWLCRVGMSDLDRRRREGKSQGLALFQQKNENPHPPCKAFPWWKKRGQQEEKRFVLTYSAPLPDQCQFLTLKNTHTHTYITMLIVHFFYHAS